MDWLRDRLVGRLVDWMIALPSQPQPPSTQTPYHTTCGLIGIGDWGELIDAGDPQSGNRFRFRFVFVSCVRASGRGEAVWACERGVFVNAGGLHSNISSSGRGFLFCVFDAMLMGFKTFWHGLLLCSWVFWSFLVFDGMLMGFLMLWYNSWSQQIISTADHNR